MGAKKSGTRGLHKLGNRSGWLCAYCQTPVFCGHCYPDGSYDSKRQASRDHIIPKSAGGTDGWANLALACARCNGYKGHLVIDQPITWAKIQEARWQKIYDDAALYGDLRKIARAKRRLARVGT